ncbi:hypothetical protein K0U27_07270 [archaeon]|nr:hypothetical protein [archaeon]
MMSQLPSDKERRTEGEIVDEFIRILREVGPMPKTSLFMRARVNSSTGARVLRNMLNWGMICHD